MSEKKIALVHDYLCGKGGSERVFQYICEIYPNADIYTLAYNKNKTFDYFRKRKIITTLMNFFVRDMNSFRNFYLLNIFFMKVINFSKYDLIISSSASIAKYIRSKNTYHISYIYTPTRAIWFPNIYFKRNLKYLIFKILLKFFKYVDYNSIKNINQIISISKMTYHNVLKFYDRQSIILNSPIDFKKFKFSNTKKDFYLIVSRLEYWKKVDYAIEAFNELNEKLIIIGTGKEEDIYKKKSNSNIKFLGEVEDSTLYDFYASAKAVIFTPYLEYGLIPLESLASGTPVICYGKGGVLETMIDVEQNKKTATSVFFFDQNKDALINAIEKFKKFNFDSSYLREYASRWSVEKFQYEIKKIINERR